MKKSIKLTINFASMVVLMTAAIVGSIVAFSFENEISTLLAPAIPNNEDISLASASGQEMSRRILEEGVVLLKNDKNNVNNEKSVLPLDRNVNNKVNVFGWHSIDWIYGSVGANASGGVAPEEGNGDEAFEKNIDIYDALSEYGIQYNELLFNMYNEYYAPIELSKDLRSAHISTTTNLIEPNINDKKYYTQELLDYSKNYSNTAIVVLSRMAGEDMNCSKTRQLKAGAGATTDNSRHYLEISTEEEAMLRYVGANFENVIVMLNMANPFECGFLDNIPGLDACMYLGFTGTRGASILPKLLYGESTPSGKTADIFAYDMFTNPANYWKDGTFTNDSGTHTPYIENIYVGYKWYETANQEHIFDNYTDANSGKKGYDGVVQFPFGYGKSYTTFDWTVDEIKIGDNIVSPTTSTVNIDSSTKIQYKVTVKNTGDYAGRDVVEAYVTSPYTKDGIEKAHVSLVSYAKTNILEPGASEQIAFDIDAYDLASYDDYDKNNNGFKGYELEKGQYLIKLMTDSHNIKNLTYKNNTIVGEFPFTINNQETSDNGFRITHDPITNKPVGNLFTGADAKDASPLDGGSKVDLSFKTPLEFFTRNKFVKVEDFVTEVNKVKIAKAPEIIGFDKASESGWNEWDNATTDIFGNKVDTSKVVWGANNGKKLAQNSILTPLGEKLGADYNDPEWDAVMEQVTYSEALNLINNYYGSKEVNSVGKPKLNDLDGPAQIKSFSSAPRGTGYPAMIVLAQTWNPKLAYEFGKSFGDDMKSVGILGLWGWAIDNHRSAFFGRNHESPSEDGFLAGTVIANAVKGLNTRGRYCFLKHFALYTYNDVANDIYTNQKGGNVYLTEQSFREIYLKAFRKAFVEGGALGAMTTYQGIGPEHSETTEALLTGVLRKEWDFKGAVTTDAISGKNYYCETIIRSGGSLGMRCALKTSYNESNTTNRLQRRIKEAVKETLYVWLRSAYNERMYLLNPDADNETFISSSSISSWVWWKPVIYCLDICIAASIGIWATHVLTDCFMKVKEEGGNENEIA